MKTGITNSAHRHFRGEVFSALLALGCTAALSNGVAKTTSVVTASDLSIVAPAGFTAPIVLQGSDPKGLPLTFSIVSFPLHGSLSGTPPNLTYTATISYVGTDSFQYVASDGQSISARAQVSITVKHAVFISNASVAEGNSGIKLATFGVNMTGLPSLTGPVSFSFTTIDGTAKAAQLDYIAASGTVGFPLGSTSLSIGIGVVGDTLVEPNETFLVQLFNISDNAVIVNATGRCTIGNDDFFQLVSVGTAALTPENSVVGVGEPVNLSLAWTHPVGWRHLDSVDLLLSDDEGTVLRARWHEAENAFSLFNPAADQFVRTAQAGSPAPLETPVVALNVRESGGGGPPGQTVTIDFGLIFKPQAAERTFSVEAFATDDQGNEQGFESVGTISVSPR